MKGIKGKGIKIGIVTGLITEEGGENHKRKTTDRNISKNRSTDEINDE